MPRTASKHPTELELQILKIFWNRGPLAVRDVRQGLIDTADRSLAHTSVVTTLNTMERKGYLKKTQVGNAYLFEALIARDAVSQGIVDDMVDQLFDGSAASLMLSLLGSDKISPDEHQELRKLIESHRKEEANS